MKNLKRLLLAVTCFFCACSSSPKEVGIEPVIQAEREALLATSQYGVYRDGAALLTFDKTLHQLYVNPSKHIYRILDNAGAKYVELRLDAAPSPDAEVNAVQSNNMNLRLSSLGKMILLKADNERLWLWCDAAHVGFIVPKGGI